MKILALSSSGIAALAISFFMLSSAQAASLDQSKIGLQLYSLRNQFQKDTPGTLDEVKAFGVRNVELAGTYNLTPEQFKQQLDARGLNAVSAHFAYERFPMTWKASRATRKFS